MVTVSTGEGSLIADLATRTGIDLPPVPEAARRQIAAALPTLGYIGNPMDPWGADEASPAYRSCFEAFAASAAYDVLALVHDFPFRSQAGETNLALELAGELVSATAGRVDLLPVFVSLTSGDVTPEVQAALDRLAASRCCAARPRGSARSLAWRDGNSDMRADVPTGRSRAAWPAMAADTPAYGSARHAPADVMEGTAAGRVLPERDSLELLRALGLPIVATTAIPLADLRAESRRAAAESATAAARAFGWPVAVKLDALDLSHKSEIGAVVLGLRDEVEVRAAVEAVIEAGRRSGAAIRGILVQPMVASAVEVIVGARRDPQFGPLVLVGLGGVLAEVLDDVAVRLAPVSQAEALAMLESLRGAAILRGFRGHPAVDVGALARLARALGDALAGKPAWREVEVNPAMAGPTGAIAVDALIVVDPPPAETPHSTDLAAVQAGGTAG